MNLSALGETLDCLFQASTAIENRARLSAQVHLENAHTAAAVAFPIGSGAAASLRDVIDAIEDEAATAGLLEVAL